MQRVFFNFQGNAVFAVLAFVGTAVGLFLLATAMVLAITAGRRRATRWAAMAGGGWIAAYAALLIESSARSRPQIAGVGEEKYFCEVDCHLAYSVIGVRREKVPGASRGDSDGRRAFTLVTLRTRFDETTISPHRGNGPLTPNGRRIAVVDARGRQYAPSGGEPTGPSTGLMTMLLPGQSYTTTLVFELPHDIRSPRLLLTEDAWVTRLLIGHENSFGHEKTLFLMEESPPRGLAPHSTRTSAFPVPILPVALSRTLTTTR